MTSFPVTTPYLRSIEVGATVDGDTIGARTEFLLRVLDEHGVEIAQGEASAIDWRVKYTFARPADVEAYNGRHLYLQVTNLSDRQARAYFTSEDRSPEVTSYLPCGREIPTLCPNPTAQDLSSLVVGRWQPW